MASQNQGIQPWERWALRITLPVLGFLLGMILNYVSSIPREIAQMSQHVAVVRVRLDLMQEQLKELKKDERIQRTADRHPGGATP